MATMDNLSSLDHFDFWFDEEENAYRFNTETGVQYYITLPEYFIMDLNVYMLNIDRNVSKDNIRRLCILGSVMPNRIITKSRNTSKYRRVSAFLIAIVEQNS